METKRTAHLVGVRLASNDPIRYFDPRDFELAVGDLVLADTKEGVREGKVVITTSQVLYSDVRGKLYRIVGRPDITQ